MSYSQNSVIPAVSHRKLIQKPKLHHVCSDNEADGHCQLAHIQN